MKTARELDIPIRRWVPDYIGVITVFLIILPVAMLNGTYTGSIVEVSNTLGVYTEDITIGYYAASAGMAISYPIVPKILNAFSSKSLLLADLTLQFFLSWFCARQNNIELLIASSFVIGFLKGFIMLWVIRRIKFIFSPNDVRSEFYAYFYPLVFGAGQLSMVVTALLAYHYDWKYMYYFMMILLLVAIVAIIVFLRHDRPSKPVALSELHLREMLIISTSILMLIYVITYGKTLDWMASSRICLYIAIGPFLLALFIWEQFHSPKPYVSLKPLLQWKAILGYFYMILIMFFSTSTNLMTSYLTTILKVDNTHSYTLYIWLLPGYIVGAIICFWWFRWQRWRFRFLIAGGMACFAFFFGSLYFTISPDSTYEMLFFPLFMRGLGMLTLIIAFALFDFPVGTYTCHGIGFLQQYIIPATAKIHGAAGREYHTDRPSCRITLFIGTDRQSATRIWNKRGHTTGNKYDEQYSAATIYTIGSETHSGMVVCGYSCYRRHIPLHSFS